MEKRFFAVGDIHGEAGKLERLINKLKSEAGMCEDDVFVQLGDIPDRGNDTKNCVNQLLELENEMECIFIRGNHEMMMLNAIQTDNLRLWDYNGGIQTRRSYHCSPAIYNNINLWIPEVPMSHRVFFYNQQYYWQNEHYWFSHAPIPKRDYTKYGHCDTDSAYFKAFHKEPVDTDILTWSWHEPFGISEDEFAMQIPGGRLQVVGHVHDLKNNLNNNARVYGHIIYMDAGSGCHPKGRLCAIELPIQKLYYVGD